MNENWRVSWDSLGNIPCDEEFDQYIQEPFLHFEIGTDKFEIWHWFEETYDIILGDKI